MTLPLCPASPEIRSESTTVVSIPYKGNVACLLAKRLCCPSVPNALPSVGGLLVGPRATAEREQNDPLRFDIL